jgi:adenosine deaminase
MAHHPLRKLTAAGIRCTLSTDDPLCFANTVNEEYSAISHGLGFTRKELARIARNGFEVASMTAGTKQPWLDQLDVILNG